MNLLYKLYLGFIFLVIIDSIKSSHFVFSVFKSISETSSCLYLNMKYRLKSHCRSTTPTPKIVKVVETGESD